MSLKDEDGNPLCEVVSRDRESDQNGNDPVLSTLDQSDFDQLWLFAVDVGNGISNQDCKGIIGNTMQTELRAIPDLKVYLRNLALWLTPEGR